MKTIFTLFVVSFLLSSCSSDLLEHSDSDPDKVFAKAYIDSLNAGAIDYCYGVTINKYQTEESKTFLEDFYMGIEDKEMKDFKIIGYRKTTMNDKAYTHLEYECDYSSVWWYYKIDLETENNEIQLTGFNAKESPQSLSQVNEFTLAGKSFGHYLMLLMMIVIPLFILFTVIQIIRTPMKRKVLWVIFALFGVIAVFFNWESGEFMFFIRQTSADGQIVSTKSAFLKISLLGAGYSRQSVLHPWMMHVAFPLGAVMFWLRREKLRKGDTENR